MTIPNLTSPPAAATNDREFASQALEQPVLENRVCRYFSRIGSCRAGNDCPFLHDDSRLPGAKARVINSSQNEVGEAAQVSSVGAPFQVDGIPRDRRQAVHEPVSAARVAQKPVPVQDPREFQLSQVRRRFSPKETTQAGGQHEGGSLLKFSIAPSDPDFPFELTALKCSLSVPLAYPKERPSLKVGNDDIPRGFAFNVEAGFDDLVNAKPDASLLELLKALDKNLETFLSAPKADTIKLVPNKDTRHLSGLPSRSARPDSATESVVNEQIQQNAPHNRPKPGAVKPVENFTDQQKADAVKRRETETRQLEARMGRLPLYKKSGDGMAYTVPLEPRRRAELPVALQAVRAVQIIVPLLYPLQACRIHLEGVNQEASKPVQVGFERNSTEHKGNTLMGHVNFLAQNMHTLAKTVVEVVAEPQVQVCSEVKPESAPKEKKVEGQQDAERSHITYITRPPEWVFDSGDESDSDDVDSYDSGDESEGGVEVEGAEKSSSSETPMQNPEKGTAISFPFIELYGIELLEVVVLNVTVKCERCKEVTEILGLKNGVTKKESCKKCATPFSVAYRRDLVHANAIRAGFLDFEGCIVGDMLPSTFMPTCSQCSTSYPSPGIVSVQGETISNVCRECHQKFTFKIPQVKFLRISTAERLPSALPRRKKETLGLTPGNELPKRGRCRHYTKSYRWFRFSCCQKVYACDKCHDEEEEHPNEWANRMICGWCSREGNYRPEDCGVCHGVLVGKTSKGGFWEGGKGTRDKVRMSRKDKRKFRRPGASTKSKT